MISMLIGFMAPIVGEKYARAASFTILALGIGLLLWGGKCAYDHSVINKYNQKEENRQLKREEGADRNLTNQVSADNAAAAEREKEFQDATKNIPDRAPSNRQRAIACSELRREAKQRGDAQPAC